MSTNALNRRIVAGGLISTIGLAAFSRSSLAAESFRIGSPNPITGAQGAFGAGIQKTAIEAAARINAIGGAGGRKLEIFAADTQTLPEPALLAAKKLVEVNKVRALIGVNNSPEALAIIPMSNAADVILMDSGAAPKIAEENTKGLEFQFYPNSSSIGSVQFQVVERQGYKRPVMITLTNDAEIGDADAFDALWKAKTGEAPLDIHYLPNQPSYQSELQKALAAKPDIIIMNSYEPDATVLMKQLYELGNTAQVLAADFAITPRLMKATGKQLVEGALVYRFVPNTESPAYREFNSIYQAVMKEPGSSNSFAAIVFDQVNLIALALEKNPAAITGAELAVAIHDVCGPEGVSVNGFAEGREALKKGAMKLNYEGASGPCDFDARGQTPANFGVTVVRNGGYEPMYEIKFKR